MKRTEVIPSLEGIRALSHPVRVRMLGMLRHEGPATATSLATRLGLNTGATSYHLRQLDKHGFIEEDEGRGDARERWWRAAHQATRIEAEPVTQEQHETLEAYLQAVGVVYAESLQRAIAEGPSLPPAWREAGDMSDWVLRVTPRRARELVDALAAVVEGWEEEPDAADAGPFRININAFVRPGALSLEPRDAGAGERDE